MKKSIITTAIITAAALSTQFIMTASAESMPYEPVFESVPITESITTAAKEQPAKSTISEVPKISSVQATTTTNTVNTAAPAENSNLQSALMQLDGAQVEIRNQLIQYKNEYSDIDNQYRIIKEQRKLKAKQIKETEKKIKSLDSTKEKIRKNMD